MIGTGKQDANDPFDGLGLTRRQRDAFENLRRQYMDGCVRIDELEKKIQDLGQSSLPTDHSAVLTRPEFNREVARMLACDERYGGVSSVLYFDIEKLDDEEKKFGKAIVNAAIREATAAIVNHVRSTDIVGRLAPAEFGVLLVRCGNGDAWRKGKELAAHVYDALVEVQGCRLNLEIAYGAYTFRPDEDVSTGLREAAGAMTKSTFTR